MFPAARSYTSALILTLATPAQADLETQLAAGDFSAAEQTLEQLSSRWELAATTDAERVEWARVLMTLGTIERKLLKSDEAEPHLRKALTLFGDMAPEEVHETREALALTLQDQGKLDEAEPLLRENLNSANPRTAAHLGLLRLQQGDYAEAGELLADAWTDTDPSDAIALARRHQDLGRYWHTLGSHARALEHFEQGLAGIGSEPTLDELRLSLLSQRALAQLRLHETESARSGFEEAASLARKVHHQQPLSALPHLENLGILALATQDPATALERFQEAVALLIDEGLSDHPAAITAWNNLAIAQMRSGDFEQARTNLLLARALQAEHLPEIHLRVAETERNLAAVCLLAKSEDAAERVRSANHIGLELLDQLLRHGTETERLNFLERIDLLSLSCTLGDPEDIANLLLASKSRLLDQLIHPEEAVKAPSWQEVQMALHPDTVFLDFCRYHPPGGEAEYGAILLKSSGAPEWFPLGSEVQLKGWIDALHARIRWKAGELAGEPSEPPPFLLTGILRELHETLIAPIAGSIPDGVTRWLLSPDGLVHSIPFAALRDREGRFLCRSLDMAPRLGSGRDLLKTGTTPLLGDHPWLLAGVSRFPSENLDPASHLAAVLDHPGALPGTKKELRRIESIAPEGSVRMINLSETELVTARPSPRVIHLSTHSFFIEPESPSDSPLDLDRSADRLFASGILLYRAGLRPPDTPLPSPSDDILFPTEIANLPLEHTRLVTLSSCHSGLGTSIRGEGQIGLQRAFALAGAREVVSALWPVSDQGSPEFMRRFYELALATGNPAQALWQTQREKLSSTDDLEAAVLLSAPFVLTQYGPALELAEVPPPTKTKSWRWLIPLPLILFILARLIGRFRHPARTAR